MITTLHRRRSSEKTQYFKVTLAWHFKMETNYPAKQRSGIQVLKFETSKTEGTFFCQSFFGTKKCHFPFCLVSFWMIADNSGYFCQEESKLLKATKLGTKYLFKMDGITSLIVDNCFVIFKYYQPKSKLVQDMQCSNWSRLCSRGSLYCTKYLRHGVPRLKAPTRHHHHPKKYDGLFFIIVIPISRECFFIRHLTSQIRPFLCLERLNSCPN